MGLLRSWCGSSPMKLIYPSHSCSSAVLVRSSLQHWRVRWSADNNGLGTLFTCIHKGVETIYMCAHSFLLLCKNELLTLHVYIYICECVCIYIDTFKYLLLLYKFRFSKDLLNCSIILCKTVFNTVLTPTIFLSNPNKKNLSRAMEFFQCVPNQRRIISKIVGTLASITY